MLNITEILEKFDKEFPEFKGAKEDEDDSYNGEITRFLRREISILLDSLKMEEEKYRTMVGVNGAAYTPESAFNREVKIRNEVIQELNNKINKINENTNHR